ncbi:Phosphatidylinositol N-acetylglucosaminyltransferase subunit A [Quillaja saponaria]|uniref:Phosphatidylinositol N-acetylglucosaminyltransferase subunit A n=1 Tax=Quillaja saponaria TaxID=32244 RepID=A0AAD7L295_QUISA|nr:Phosphatidylinositol N-acetylglucosaminyltransferase subunit A [Quillaja saponaria]
MKNPTMADEQEPKALRDYVVPLVEGLHSSILRLLRHLWLPSPPLKNHLHWNKSLCHHSSGQRLDGEYAWTATSLTRPQGKTIFLFSLSIKCLIDWQVRLGGRIQGILQHCHSSNYRGHLGKSKLQLKSSNQVLPDDMVVLAEPDPDDMVQAIQKAITMLPKIDPQVMHTRYEGNNENVDVDGLDEDMVHVDIV